MGKFEPLSDLPVSENEQQISKFWEEIDILDKCIETREGSKPFIFYEGLLSPTVIREFIM